jgi:uncharacterized membrane protein
MMALLLAAHTLAVIVWVGGMFFAHMVLRPGAGSLGAAVRLPLWARVFQGFFPWVWLCVLTILASGFTMIGMSTGFAAVPLYINAMMALGMVMAGIFWAIYFGSWPCFRAAVQAEDWSAADAAIARMRMLVRMNLILGVIAALAGSGGRYFL